VLRGIGVGATVIDHDPGQIETVRRFGFKAYYGDATRLDLLASAGAAQAKVLLMGIDDARAAMAAVKRVRQRFPHLEIIVRAHGRTDAYEYAEMGIPAVRELFGASLEAAVRTLILLGYERSDAERMARRFREYDEQQLVRNAQHRNDLSRLIALTEQGRRDIQQLLAAEAKSAPKIHEDDAGTDGEGRDGEPARERL
jgi:voltage-gated potassium channel Kch